MTNVKAYILEILIVLLIYVEYLIFKQFQKSNKIVHKVSESQFGYRNI